MLKLRYTPSSKAEKSVDLITINDEEDEESAEDALRRKKGKGIEEIKIDGDEIRLVMSMVLLLEVVVNRDSYLFRCDSFWGCDKYTPTTTLTSPRTHTDSLSTDKKELQELTNSESIPSSSKPKTDRVKHYKSIFHKMSRRYRYMFRHLKQSFMPRKDFHAILEVVHKTLNKVVRKLFHKNTNDFMKNNIPKVVAEAIRLEREKVKGDIAVMVVDAVKKERESIRAELSLHVTNDVANTVPPQIDSFLRNYMSNHILYVHPTEDASSFILDLQHQLYLQMKDDEQARDADLSIWLSLKIKFEKPAPLVEPCRVTIVRTRDHKDHHDDDARPEGESSTKRLKTSEHGTYTTGESSSSQAINESTPSGLGTQKEL
ncbi:hypothetical protein Tco_0139404 [Tanacetum coccineum]